MTGMLATAAVANDGESPEAQRALRLTLDKPSPCRLPDVALAPAAVSAALTVMDWVESCASALGSRPASGAAAMIQDDKTRMNLMLNRG